MERRYGQGRRMRANAYDALDRRERPGTQGKRLSLRKCPINRITQSKRPAATGRQRPEAAGRATALSCKLVMEFLKVHDWQIETLIGEPSPRWDGRYVIHSLFHRWILVHSSQLEKWCREF